jgi:hypothetical protein
MVFPQDRQYLLEQAIVRRVFGVCLKKQSLDMCVQRLLEQASVRHVRSVFAFPDMFITSYPTLFLRNNPAATRDLFQFELSEQGLRLFSRLQMNKSKIKALHITGSGGPFGL